MFSSCPVKIAFAPARARGRRSLARRTAWVALLAATCSGVSIPVALPQTDAPQRVAMQEDRPKTRIENHRPLESDALYVCTLSGFGNLAHCYPR